MSSTLAPFTPRGRSAEPTTNERKPSRWSKGTAAALVCGAILVATSGTADARDRCEVLLQQMTYNLDLAHFYWGSGSVLLGMGDSATAMSQFGTARIYLHVVTMYQSAYEGSGC